MASGTSSNKSERTLKTEPGEFLLARLRVLRRRLFGQLLVEQFARGMLVGVAIVVLFAVCERWAGTRIHWPMVWAGLAAGVVCVTVIGSLIRLPRIREFAHLLDRLGATRDRWTTALAFSGSRDEVQTLAVNECAGYLAARDFRDYLPWKWPRALTWLAAPLLTAALLQWDLRSKLELQAEERAAAQEEVAPTVQQLQKLAQQVENAKQKTASAELERVAEQLKRSAQQLHADATERETATKSALRELSSLEQLVKELQKQSTQLTPEEKEALAKALEQQEETKQAAQALQSGNAADAAKALEEAAQQLQDNKNEAASQQTEKTLRDAMERLAQQRQRSEAMRQLAQQLKERLGNGGAEQMLRQLAQTLRQAPQGADGNKDVGKNDKNAKQTLEGVIAALQNMKQGQQGQQGQGNKQAPGEQGQQGGQVAMESFAIAGSSEPPQGGNADTPTGQPGSEHDVGTTESPFGDKPSEPADKGGELSLRGQLGEGESLSQLLPTAGGDDKARRRYKELYEAVRPAAEEAVLQENIPLGSRFFIRRYFEAIRPPE